MKLGLNGNALKVLAMVSMFIDHFGMIFFPYVIAFRIVGRLAFPIYAYLIAEGCKYTHDRRRYFLQMLVLGVVCSAVYIVVEDYVYLCILMTFSVSILLIYLLDYVKLLPKKRWWMFLLGLVGAWLACSLVEFDYGYFGVLVPVFAYLSEKRHIKLGLFTVGLLLLSLSINNGVQWYSLVAVLPIALYNGERGKLNLKWFFYLFYPLHLAVLWGVYSLMYANT